LAGQVIVRTEQILFYAPGCLCATAQCVRETANGWWFRVLNFPYAIGEQLLEEEMKLYLFFVLIDLLILLAYPFIFIASKVRKYFGFKG
jgi:hypothetical protein